MGLIFSLVVIVLVAYLIIKKYNPQAVLIFGGFLMMALAIIFGIGTPLPEAKSTGFVWFDMVEYVKSVLSSRGAGLGLLIMAVGGFSVYISKIGASDALVYLIVKPVSKLKSPYILAALVVPIGHLLSVFISSATGLGLLLMASIYPVLTRLGVSKLTATSVITSTLVFDMGPSSGNTNLAADTINMDVVEYFLSYQLPLIIPSVLALAVFHYFVQKYFDKKDGTQSVMISQEEQSGFKPDAPLIYAIIPILPILFIVTFSKFFNSPIKMNVTTAMLLSLFIAMVFEIVRHKNLKDVFASLQVFWDGMGRVFASVVTLIIAGQTFAQGLKSLGFISGLVSIGQGFGFSAVIITFIFAVFIFLTAVLMGSGNAPFFSFGPMVPDIAKKIGGESLSMILPMQLAAGVGRTMSPIAGVVVAASGISGVSPFDVAKRNAIPMVAVLIVMFALNFLIY